MPQEQRFWRGGEVDFRLRQGRDIPPEYYQLKRSSTSDLWSGAIWIIAFIILGLWLASCGRHDDTVTVKTSDGQVLHMNRKDAQSTAVTSEDFSWDFTKVKHPDEPTLAIPQATKTK